MVDAPGLGPGGATRGGSSPLLGTIVSGFMDLRSAGQARFAIQGTLPCCRALPFRAGCVSLRGAHLRRSAWCLVPLEPFRPALRACGRPCFVTVSDPPPGSRKLARDTLLVSQRGKRVIAPRPRLTSNPAPFAQLLKALLGTFEATVKSTSPASGRSPRGETVFDFRFESFRVRRPEREADEDSSPESTPRTLPRGCPPRQIVFDRYPGSRKLARDKLLVSQRAKRVIAPQRGLTGIPAPFA